MLKEDIYKIYSKLNPYNGIGMGEKYCKKENGSWKYFIPAFLNKNSSNVKH